MGETRVKDLLIDDQNHLQKPHATCPLRNIKLKGCIAHNMYIWIDLYNNRNQHFRPSNQTIGTYIFVFILVDCNTPGMKQV